MYQVHTALCQNNLSAEDSTGYIYINKILIVGNKKTKSRIITRELSFKEGDSIAANKLSEEITKSRNRVFNTNLFTNTEIQIIDKGSRYRDVAVMVKERWYIYPIPIFELADRNFNEWWQERDRDPKRINLGILYVQKNMRGRNETLRAKFQLGFTKKFELLYFFPYIDKKQRIGMTLDFSYIINKQIYYKTANHKLIYFDGNEYIRDKFRSGIIFSYRKKFYQSHHVGISYYQNVVADTILKLNPIYMRSGNLQRYFYLRYTFINDLRDITYYPLKGSYLKLEAEKLGLGIFKDINQVNFNMEASLFRPVAKKLFLAAGIKQKVSFPIVQSYINVRALGYDKDYVSGYELYVIDGQHFSLTKINLKYQLFSNMKKHPAEIKPTQLVPIAVYLKAYADGGYVQDKYINIGKLSNKLLMGGGLGLDIVSYYDFVMRMEYSYNISREHGFFLHFRSAI
ncbi:MAG: BamA/TamA family outer membrane protein [Cytophagaceae bacterium]|nr:BamA/TamA family outer membrane protein [Cytophagaceae bacterium]